MSKNAKLYSRKRGTSINLERIKIEKYNYLYLYEKKRGEKDI